MNVDENDLLTLEELLEDQEPDPKEQVVSISLVFPPGALRDGQPKLDAVFSLENIFIEVVEETGVGQFDGNEFCECEEEDSVTFFISGQDADLIFETIRPILMCLPELPGSSITKRYSMTTNQKDEILLADLVHER